MGQFKFTLNEEEYQMVMRKLGQLSTADQRAVIKTAMRQSGNILIQAGKSSFLAHNKKKTGNLYRSFTSKFKKKNSGILVGFRRGIGLGNHAHLIDKGTTHRWTLKPYIDKLGRSYPAGIYRGRINEPTNGKTGKTFFWSDVVEAKGQDAMNRIMDAVYDAVEEIKNRN